MGPPRPEDATVTFGFTHFADNPGLQILYGVKSREGEPPVTERLAKHFENMARSCGATERY
jgi:hypothetical protein